MVAASLTPVLRSRVHTVPRDAPHPVQVEVLRLPQSNHDYPCRRHSAQGVDDGGLGQLALDFTVGYQRRDGAVEGLVDRARRAAWLGHTLEQVYDDGAGLYVGDAIRFDL